MSQKRYRIRSTNLEAYQGQEVERLHIELHEVDTDGKFVTNGDIINLRSAASPELSMTDTYLFNLQVESA